MKCVLANKSLTITLSLGLLLGLPTAAYGEDLPEGDGVAEGDPAPGKGVLERLRSLNIEDPPEGSFVKGPLAHVGNVGFYQPKRGIYVGTTYFYTSERLPDGQIHRTHYMGAVPEAYFSIKDVDIGLGIPIAFEVYDHVADPLNPLAAPGGEGFQNAGTFANFMWDEPQELAQVINYIRYGDKEQPLYVDVSRVSSASLGHGTVLRRYSANVTNEQNRVGASVDYAHDYGGVEFFTNNILGYDLTGFLAFARPGAYLLPNNLFARSASLGFTYVVDRKAPLTLAMSGDGIKAGALGRPEVEEAKVLGVMGFDGEVKILKNRRMDVKAYGDVSWLTIDGGTAGTSVGALGRFNLGRDGDSARYAFRTRAEAQVYGSHYDPGYFDTFYEFQRYDVSLDPETAPETKLAYVLGREEGVETGLRLEGTVSRVNRAALSLMYETNTAGDKTALAHVEVPTFEKLRLMGTAARVGFGGAGELFAPGPAHTILMARADLAPWDWLMLRGEVAHLYRLSSIDTGLRPAEGEASVMSPTMWWNLSAMFGSTF